MNIKELLLCALLCTPGAAAAADWQPLTGTYAVTGASVIDPMPEESPNSHFRMQLTGASAKDLYLALPGSPVIDECTGGQSKSSGELQCLYFKDGDHYECAFAIDLVENKIDFGIVC